MSVDELPTDGTTHCFTVCLRYCIQCSEFCSGWKRDPFPILGQMAPNWVRAEHWTGTTDFTHTELSMNVAWNTLFIVRKNRSVGPRTCVLSTVHIWARMSSEKTTKHEPHFCPLLTPFAVLNSLELRLLITNSLIELLIMKQFILFAFG